MLFIGSRLLIYLRNSSLFTTSKENNSLSSFYAGMISVFNNSFQNRSEIVVMTFRDIEIS